MRKNEKNSRQVMFLSMVVGILLYSVVLGFFNDYSSILQTSSYSVTFSLAIVMQLLTYLTFELKNKIQAFFSSRDKKVDKLAMAFFVWLTLFLSKFVFLWVISFVFRQEVYISGFVGLFIIIIVLTAIQGLFDFAYSNLAD
jgi:uncharacterized membrane protein